MFDAEKAKALLTESMDGKPNTGGIVSCMDETGMAKTVAGGDNNSVVACLAVSVRDIARANHMSDKRMLHTISQLLRQIDMANEQRAAAERTAKQEATKAAMKK